MYDLLKPPPSYHCRISSISHTLSSLSSSFLSIAICDHMQQMHYFSIIEINLSLLNIFFFFENVRFSSILIEMII